jgi:phage host-nuclease inhibitor protein Gam
MAISIKNPDLKRWYQCYLINHGVKKSDATVDWVISEMRVLWDKNQLLGALTRKMKTGTELNSELVGIHESYASKIREMEDELRRLRALVWNPKDKLFDRGQR